MSAIEKEFDKNELINLVIAEVGENPQTVTDIVDATFNILIEKVSEMGYAQLHGFGSFSLRELPAESGIDPHGNAYDVPKRVTVEFNPFKPFRDKLAALNGVPAIR